MMNHNLWTSIRRTVIPYLVGALLATPVALLFNADDLTTMLTIVFGSVYYGVARWAEEQGHPWATWFIAFGPVPTPHYDIDTGVLVEVPLEEWLGKDSGDGSTAA
jgi:hypothetical protein